MSDCNVARQLNGWRQTTAIIIYRMPGHQSLVQTFIWQDLDRFDEEPARAFPRLRKFCTWWNANLDGAIVHVTVGAIPVITAGEMRHVGTELRLH